MIATCYRLKLLSFDNVAMNVPIEPNRKRGRPKATVRALLKQNERLREVRGIDNEDETSEDDEENEQTDETTDEDTENTEEKDDD